MLKKQNGITLIALIITIIVMLILVGVTINVALNGGLFEKAETATRATEEKAILEEMLAMMEITDDGKINAQSIIDKMKEKYTVEGSSPNIKIKGKLGIYNYIVSETEIKIGESDVPQEDEDFKKYILGATGTGRPLLEFDEEGNIIGGIFNFSGFVDDQLTEGVDETETLGVEYLTAGQSEDKIFMYAKYDNKAYKIICDETTFKSEKLEVIYEPQGREGQPTADGWTIIYDNGSTVEAVSPETLGSLRLGYSETATTNQTQLTEAIDSYNNAITIINNYCKNELTGLPTNINVRSVGASSDTSGNYYSDDLAKVNSTYNEVGKKGDTFFEQDLVRMAYWGVHNTGTEYWIASRNVYETSDSVYYCINSVDEDGMINNEDLWYAIINGGAGSQPSKTCAVRPIITIQNP